MVFTQLTPTPRTAFSIEFCVLRLALRMERGGDVLAAGRGRIAVVDDDQDVVALVEHGVADAAGQPVMPEAAVAHHRDGALAGLHVERRGAGGAEAVAHRGGADVERREDREQVAADVGADVMRAEFALDELHRGEDRPLRAAGAERRRPAVHLVGRSRPAPCVSRCLSGATSARGRRRRQQIGPHLVDELADAFAHHAAGVFAGHRQHVLAVHPGLDVGAAQDGVDGLLDVVRLAFLDDQDRLLAGAEADELLVDQRIGDVQSHRAAPCSRRTRRRGRCSISARSVVL